LPAVFDRLKVQAPPVAFATSFSPWAARVQRLMLLQGRRQGLNLMIGRTESDFFCGDVELEEYWLVDDNILRMVYYILYIYNPHI